MDTTPEARSLADRCRASCAWRECTGTGSLAAWAHECVVVGIPVAVPSCSVPSCPEPGRLYLGGRLCEAHGPGPAPVPGEPITSHTWTRRAPEDYGQAVGA